MSDDISLQEYVESRFVAFGARLDAYVNQHREMHEKMAEQLVASAAAVDRRLEGMNELRTQLNMERGQFVTRDMLDQRSSAVDIRFQDLGKRMDQRFEEQTKRISDMERAKANLEGRMATWGAFLMAVSVIVPIIISIVTHFWRSS